MNKIPSVFPMNLQKFFAELRNYVDEDIYFYGSCIRGDYHKNQSDIDMCIFSDNEKSIIEKIKYFLNGEKKNIKKIVWRYEKNIIHGYKLKFKVDGTRCEIHAYNENFKDIILPYIRIPLSTPFYANWMLHILKLIYYTIPILPKDIYIIMKGWIMKNVIINKDSEFLVI